MVDDIVPVHAAGSRLKVGRTVHVRNAQSLQIIGCLHRIVERKVAMELHPVCGRGDTSHILAAHLKPLHLALDTRSAIWMERLSGLIPMVPIGLFVKASRIAPTQGNTGSSSMQHSQTLPTRLGYSPHDVPFIARK